jgi:hypothetical protein
MARIGRFQLVVGLALGASLVFLGFLLARPVGDGSVQPTANLAQLLAPSLARPAARGRRRRDRGGTGGRA